MGVREIIDYLFLDSSIVFLMIKIVEMVGIAISATTLLIGIIFYIAQVLMGKQEWSLDGIVRAVVMPIILVGLLFPASQLTENGESLAVSLVRYVFEGGGYVADELSNRVGAYLSQYANQTATITGYNPNVQPIYTTKFTELASGFMESAKGSAEVLRTEISNQLDEDIASQTWIEEHPTLLAALLGMLVGVGTKVADYTEAPASVGQILSKKMLLLSTVSAGAGGAAKYAFFSLLMGVATDIIWRLMIILWIIKVSAILILTPLAAVVGLLSFNWGFSNLGRFFLSVIGLAITPVAMIAILGGSMYAYALSIQIVSGMDAIFETIFRVFLAIAYPLVVGMTLLRVGEIISYVIGVSSFAIASVASVYARPQQVIMDAMPR